MSSPSETLNSRQSESGNIGWLRGESAMDRRTFLESATVLGGSLLAWGVNHAAVAATARIDVPVVDRVVVREITDGAHDVFLRASNLAASRCSAPDPTEQKAGRCTANGGWRCISSRRKAGETRRYLLDFGFTPDAYANNLDFLKIDPSTVDALILSHGHYDHVGGLIGFLEARRAKMRKDLRLYTGGEDNFCHRMLAQSRRQIRRL